MTNHDKKRILDADINTLIDEFLEVRLQQTANLPLKEFVELESRATSILQTINGKNADIARLFPDEASLFDEASSMDIFKKRNMLRLQLQLLPPRVPIELKSSLQKEYNTLCSMIDSLGSSRVSSIK